MVRGQQGSKGINKPTPSGMLGISAAVKVSVATVAIYKITGVRMKATALLFTHRTEAFAHGTTRPY